MSEYRGARQLAELSNWGRWGADDQRGALNLINEDIRRAAATLVVSGRAVSCSWEIDDITRYMKRSAEPLLDTVTASTRPRWHSTVEYLAFQFHGHTMTHVDSPAHMFWDGRAYNDVTPAQVSTEFGAQALAVTEAADGVFTRGVLLDLPEVAGVGWLPRGTAVTPADLDAAEQKLNVTVGAGDALMIRVGHDAVRSAQGVAAALDGPSSGLDASCLDWLAERDVAVLGSDATHDVLPFRDDVLPIPIHVVGIRNLGLWLIDNGNFEQLALTCRAEGRYQFLFSMQPLRLTAATGSPVNPIAVF